jgi:hypothetical protein
MKIIVACRKSHIVFAHFVLVLPDKDADKVNRSMIRGSTFVCVLLRQDAVA